MKMENSADVAHVLLTFLPIYCRPCKVFTRASFAYQKQTTLGLLYMVGGIVKNIEVVEGALSIKESRVTEAWVDLILTS